MKLRQLTPCGLCGARNKRPAGCEGVGGSGGCQEVTRADGRAIELLSSNTNDQSSHVHAVGHRLDAGGSHLGGGRLVVCLPGDALATDS